MVHFLQLELHWTWVDCVHGAFHLSAYSKCLFLRTSRQLNKQRIGISVTHFGPPFTVGLDLLQRALQCLSTVRNNRVGNVDAWHSARKRSRCVAVRHVGNQLQCVLFGVQDPVENLVRRLFEIFLDLNPCLQNFGEHARQDALPHITLREHHFVRAQVQFPLQLAQKARRHTVIVENPELLCASCAFGLADLACERKLVQ